MSPAVVATVCPAPPETAVTASVALRAVPSDGPARERRTRAPSATPARRKTSAASDWHRLPLSAAPAASRSGVDDQWLFSISAASPSRAISSSMRCT